MKMKTIYEKPEAQLRPSVIRCSILAGSGNGSSTADDIIVDNPGNLGARKRGGSLDNASEGRASDVKNALSF